jgi:N-acetylglutamate synthase
MSERTAARPRQSVPSPDTLAGEFAQAMKLAASAAPGSWLVAAAGWLGGATGAPMPTLNGAWSIAAGPAAAAVGALLDQVATTGLPYCLQARPGAQEAAAAVAAARGMAEAGPIPLMALADPAALAAAQQAAGLAIRVLTAAEASLHIETAAAGFGAPPAAVAALATPEFFALPGIRYYVGEVGGEAVTTGMSLPTGAGLAILSVATVPGHTRRGYGAAVTARAVADGLADGAQFAWLQSSAAGYGVYERLGFTTSETWRCWVAGA